MKIVRFNLRKAVMGTEKLLRGDARFLYLIQASGCALQWAISLNFKA
ncbi:MAG: hypothetical protein P8Y12_01410 [Gammaproteobacteria bacterium]